MSESDSDGEGEGGVSALRAQQRREIKAMQADIQRLKKTVPKGDNKRKKAVQVRSRCLLMSIDLIHHHQLSAQCSCLKDDHSRVHLSYNACHQ